MQDEELTELRNGGADLPVVAGFAPIGKAFPGGPQEPGSCLMKKRIHEPRSEKLKGAGTQGLRDAGTQGPRTTGPRDH